MHHTLTNTTYTCEHTCIHTNMYTHTSNTHCVVIIRNPTRRACKFFSFPHSPSSSQFVRGVPLCAPHLPVSFQRTPSPYPLGHFLVHCVLRARAFVKLRSLALGSWDGEKLTEQVVFVRSQTQDNELTRVPTKHIKWTLPPGSLSIPQSLSRDPFGQHTTPSILKFLQSLFPVPQTFWLPNLFSLFVYPLPS